MLGGRLAPGEQRRASGRAEHGALQTSPGAAPTGSSGPRTPGQAKARRVGSAREGPRVKDAGPQGSRRTPKHLPGYHHPQV